MCVPRCRGRAFSGKLELGIARTSTLLRSELLGEALICLHLLLYDFILALLIICDVGEGWALLFHREILLLFFNLLSSLPVGVLDWLQVKLLGLSIRIVAV